MAGFSCKSALENCTKPPPLPAKRAGARRGGEVRARKNGVSDEKVTPDGIYLFIYLLCHRTRSKNTIEHISGKVKEKNNKNNSKKAKK